MKRELVSHCLLIAILLVACSDGDNSVVARDSEGTLLSSSETSGEISSSSSDGFFEAVSSSSFGASSSSVAPKSCSSDAMISSSYLSSNSLSSSSLSSSSSSSNDLLSSSSHESSSSSIFSSSSVESSSSVIRAVICKTDSTDTCEYGSVTDNRDGKTYKTVKIGEQWWMAENLNFNYGQPTAGLDSSSFCYNDSLEYCEKYGRLYLFSAAMDSAGVYSASGQGCGFRAECVPDYPVRGVCPEGWHLPDTTEWYALFSSIEAYRYKNSNSTYTNYELNAQSCSGKDSYGFSSLPGGWVNFNLSQGYGSIDYSADYWTSTPEHAEVDWTNSSAYLFDMSCSESNVYLMTKWGTFGMSVRCVKD